MTSTGQSLIKNCEFIEKNLFLFNVLIYQEHVKVCISSVIFFKEKIWKKLNITQKKCSQWQLKRSLQPTVYSPAMHFIYSWGEGEWVKMRLWDLCVSLVVSLYLCCS